MNLHHAFTTAVSATLLFSACTAGGSNDIALVDLSKSYPEKTLMLSDIAAVDYVCFHSTDGDSVYNGRILSITPNVIVLLDAASESARFFTRYGRPLARGGGRTGAVDGTVIYRAAYDEAQDELYVLPIPCAATIAVYGSDGVHKRSMALPAGACVDRLYVLDGSSLLINDVNALSAHPTTRGRGFGHSFVRIAKSDAKALCYLPVPDNPQAALHGLPVSRLLKSREGYLVYNPECDTLFACTRDLQLRPVMVQTPSAGTTPGLTMNSYVEAGPYQFIEVLADSLTRPAFHLARDKEEDEIYTAKVLMNDYEGREVAISPATTSMSDVPQLGSIELTADELQRALADNKLSGKLREIAAVNAVKGGNVYVIMKFK
jgi:hypothetical protein